jgi:predicted DNA-binding protein (UPF0251 family)
MERIAMSQEERDCLDWLKRARDKKMTQREASEKMDVSERWVRKLLQRMKEKGDAVVVHGLRGRTSNRKIRADLETKAMDALRQPEWHDFGPTFASEQLAKRHSIEVSDETLRQWMIRAGLWKPKARRCALLEATPKRVRGVGAMGHIGTRLAGRARTGTASGAHDR